MLHMLHVVKCLILLTTVCAGYDAQLTVCVNTQLAVDIAALA